MHSEPESRRRRWPAILVLLVVIGAGLWTAAWFYAANAVETLVEAWKQREAQSGRVYQCGSQAVGGYPFRIEVRCADAVASLQSTQPPLSLKAKDIVVAAQVWQPTVLTAAIASPVEVAMPGAGESVVAEWTSATVTVHGLPTDPQAVGIVLDAPRFERRAGGPSQPLFGAKRLDVQGRIVDGSSSANPVVQIAVALAGASASDLHPLAAEPIDLQLTSVLRGLKNFAPKTWPDRFRELQAAGGRIDVTSARIAQGESLGIASGTLGLSPRGRLDGQLQVTVANLEKLLPALGIDKMLPQAQNNQMNAAIGALDRLSPGLGNIARQNAGPAIVAGLNFLGQPTDLEGKRAVRLPFRFSDGAASLGPIPLGAVAPLY